MLYNPNSRNAAAVTNGPKSHIRRKYNTTGAAIENITVRANIVRSFIMNIVLNKTGA